MDRRTFLKLSGLAASAWTGLRLATGKTVAAVQAVCVPRPGTVIPLAVPWEVGDDCAPTRTPAPTQTATTTTTATATTTTTATATVTATRTATVTLTPTPTASATPRPVWQRWFPLIRR